MLMAETEGKKSYYWSTYQNLAKQVTEVWTGVMLR